MTGMENARARLDHYMNSRRLDLRLTWVQVAERARVSRDTVHEVRYGDREIRELTKRGVEDALEWAHGSVDSILAGGEPTEAGHSRELPDGFEQRKRALMEVLTPEEGRMLEVAIEMIERDRERRREARDQKVRRGRTSA